MNPLVPAIPIESRAIGGGSFSAIRFETEAAIIEAQILKLIEENPEAAAKSWLGRAHLVKYGWMLEDPEGMAGCKLWTKAGDWDYPRKFEIGDCLLDGKEITLQLIAEEYFEDAGELTPFTLDIVGLEMPSLPDPFMSDWRPAVTLEHDGEVMNMSPRHLPQPKPEHGFKELDFNASHV